MTKSWDLKFGHLLVMGHWSFHDRENVFLAHDHQLFAVEFDFGSGVAGEDDFVAFLDAEGGALAAIQALAVAQSEDLAAFGFFLGAVGQDDPALGFGLGFDSLDQNLVSERTKFRHDDAPLLNS